MSLTWSNETRRLEQLKRWENNPKFSTEKQAENIANSYRLFGQPETIAIGPDDEVYNGHQRLSSWLAEYGPKHIVDVRVSSRILTEDEKTALFAYLHFGAVGSTDWDKLPNLDVDILKEFGFNESLFKSMKVDLSGLSELLKSNDNDNNGKDAEPQIDLADQLRKKWGVEVGQLWELGDHRIICGDCTDESVVDMVMGGEMADLVFTDPPYGVAIGEKNKFLNSFQPSGRNLNNIANDLLGKDKLFDMLVGAFTITKSVMHNCAAIYVTAPQGGELGMMMMMMMMSGLPVRHVLNWVKNSPTFSMGRLDYEYQHEPILYSWKKTHKYYGNGAHKSSVWFIDKPRSSKEHPTMKPVELVENAILNSSKENDVLYEPFSGSGTTIIACQNLNRRCRAIEIDPGYVAIAIQRWVDLTDKEPKLISG